MMSETEDDNPADEQTTTTREHTVEGEIFSEIPDNWTGVAPFQNGDLYRIPETDSYVEVETNVYPNNEEHEVHRVGDLESGIAHDMDHDALKDELEKTRELHEDGELRYSDAEAEKILEALELLDEHWDRFSDEHERLFTNAAIDYLIDSYETERVSQHSGYDSKRGFVPDPYYPVDTDLLTILRDLDRDDLLDVTDELTSLLQDGGVLPSDPELRLTVESDYEKNLLGLIEAGCSTAAAVDYLQTVVGDKTHTEWADCRGVDQSTVSGNVSAALDQIQH